MLKTRGERRPWEKRVFFIISIRKMLKRQKRRGVCRDFPEEEKRKGKFDSGVWMAEGGGALLTPSGNCGLQQA